MAHSTYSFTDISASISHPSYGSHTMQGAGIGDLTLNKNTDRTAHDEASDGHIMASKKAGKNGTGSINAPQPSGLHNWPPRPFN